MKLVDLVCLIGKYVKKRCELTKYYLSKPFLYVKAVYKVLSNSEKRDYSDNWENYVKRKTSENELEMKRKESQHELETTKAKNDVYINMLRSMYQIRLLIIPYISVASDKQKNEIIVEFSDKFQQLKEDFSNYSKEFEQMGGKVPNELKELISEAEVNSFNDKKAYDEFSKRIDTLKEQIVN